MSDNNLQRKIMLDLKVTVEQLLTHRTYKKNPKKLYRQLLDLQNRGKTPTSARRTKELLAEFKIARSPEEYPELWI